MKTKIIPLVCLLVIFCCSNLTGKEANTRSDPPAAGTTIVYSTAELYELSWKWADEFNKTHPGTLIQVVRLNDTEISASISKNDAFCFVSNEFPVKGDKQPAFRLVVGREIIVPVISAKNPWMKEISEKGISREALAKSLEKPGQMKWGTLLQNDVAVPVRYLVLNDDFTKSGVKGFINISQQSMAGLKSEDRDAMLSVLQNDPYAVGFCRMTDILQPGREIFAEDIRLMPIDKNGNGKMDYMEDIYNNFQDFTRGVWIGKYPKSLTSSLYCISGSQPADESGIAFLHWILGKGQDLLPASGYSDLVSSERQSQLSKLNEPLYITETPKQTDSFWKITITILALVILISFVLDLVISRFRSRKSGETGLLEESMEGFDERNVKVPKGLYYDKTHTWAFMEQDGSVKIGIDDFLQHVTGPITSIGMKKPGDRIKKGDTLCIIIQKGKHLNIYAPVSGTIRAYNQVLSTNSSVINTSPYTDGWVYTIAPSNWLREIEFLSMADKYRLWLSSEFTRLKDFLASSFQADSPRYARIVLQDGGIIRDHVLADLSPEVWEDFQTKFINASK